jgi:TPR repeat protein
MRQFIVVFYIVLMSISTSAFAQMLDLEKIIPLAEKGIVKQQYNLAYSYFYGYGVAPDKTKAMYWLNMAAKGDDGPVHYKIGRLFETGEIYPQNSQKAFEHYLLSAKAGDPYGTVNLSVMYFQGKGVKKDTNEGIKWAEKAAKKGFVNAQINLALLYNAKNTAVHDKNKAMLWFAEAALNGSVLAQYEIGKHHLKNKNYDEAFENFDLAVEGKNTDAMIMLAMMFEQGLATEQSSETSLKLLQLAHNLGNKKAAKYLNSFRTNKIKVSGSEQH